MKKYPPEQNYFFFWVAPNSFDLFREIRKTLWEHDLKSAGNQSEKIQLYVTAVVMLKAEGLIRNKIILNERGNGHLVRKKSISKDDKNLIAELDQQIRSYVLEYGTSRDSELLDQAIADINKTSSKSNKKVRSTCNHSSS